MRKKLVWISAVLAVAGFIATPFLALKQAPLAYELFFNQKIFYYHVGAAVMMFVSAFVCGIASIFYLAKRDPEWDDLAAAGGDLVVIMGAVVLTTGPIWGKVAWGVYWVWDARLTTSMLLWMIFIAYALVRRYGGPGSARLAAGLALFGMADVPLVYFAVNFWKTQHPSNSVIPKLQGGMRTAFYVSLAAYLFLYIVYLAARRAIQAGERRLAAVHEMAADAGMVD